MSANVSPVGTLSAVFSTVLTVVGGRVISSHPVQLSGHGGHFNLGGQEHFSSDLQLSAADGVETISSMTGAMQGMAIEEGMDTK